ncbi:hypothetical protein BDY19DRAFT_1030884 [Irpex rosettiformis]|uniref:Uncharacterized protein n=1 Tax=Irpex rosettiformis TaxID=378272 RepID=A0ACB8UB40_9APHY|nr:hypothetical protein BDY19DRAFT_1030884 [Irpex rosettiformis]
MHSPSLLSLPREDSDRAYYCRIGKRPVPTPMVTLPQLKAHLSLLRAIQDLRTTVEEGTDERFPEYVKSLQAPQRWIWIVGLAIERFMKWIHTVEQTDLSAWVEDQLPPLDVLMVWHTYMLNPHWYAEDCDRLMILRGLKNVDGYLIRSLVAVGDIGAYEPSDAHRQAWHNACGTSWDPLNAAGDGTLEYHGVVCPQCLVIQSVPNVDGKGHGYLQNDFCIDCTYCGGLITKERLVVHKLVRDIVRNHRVDDELHKHGLGVYLAGTLRTSKRAADISNAASIKKRLWNLKICSDSLAAVVHQHIRQGFPTKDSKKSVFFTVPDISPSPPIRINHILSAYVSDRPFSVELVGAILRQGSFIHKIHQLGWTVQDRFHDEEESVVLEHAIARYHAFLDLLSTSTTALFVPTLDIDLVWHTHQLLGQRYADDCLKYVGRYIDHDDKVEESRLANSFDETCRAWQATPIRCSLHALRVSCADPRDRY